MKAPVPIELAVLDPAANGPALEVRALPAATAGALRSVIGSHSGDLEGCFFRLQKAYTFNARPSLVGVMGNKLDDDPRSTVGFGGFAFTIAASPGAKEQVHGWLVANSDVLDEAWADADRAGPFKAGKPTTVPCLILRTVNVDPMAAGQMREHAINIAAAWLQGPRTL